MKDLIRTILMMVLSVLLVFPAAQAQQQPMDGINQAVRTGHVDGIVKYFSPVVDITINNSQSSYSRTQGEMVLRDFFSKNVPKGFEVDHTGNSGSGTTVYTIGTLLTSTGRYQVYISLKQKDNTYTVKEIRIQK